MYIHTIRTTITPTITEGPLGIHDFLKSMTHLKGLKKKKQRIPHITHTFKIMAKMRRKSSEL